MRKVALAALLAAAVMPEIFAPWALAQTPNPVTNIDHQAMIARERPRWIRYLDQPDKAGGDIAWQTATMTGREDLKLQFDDMFLRQKNRPPIHKQEKCAAAVPGDPVAEIVRRARETTIVLISEFHDDPRNRAFAARVVQALRSEGYEIFAVETLFYEFSPLPGSLLTDGHYTMEPAFGAELALAKRLGYRLVAYEITDAQDEELRSLDDRQSVDGRQRMQAENLISAIFEATPKAKVIIHAGGAHERSNPGDPCCDMAEHLKRLTGVDLLTINQRDCTSPTDSIVLATGFDPPGPTRSDLFVGQPPLTFKDGRPAWRQEAGQKPVPVPASFLSAKESIIVEARPVGVSLEVVPTDRLYLRPGEKLPLLLPPGQYRVDAWTGEGPLNNEPEMVTVK